MTGGKGARPVLRIIREAGYCLTEHRRHEPIPQKAIGQDIY